MCFFHIDGIDDDDDSDGNVKHDDGVDDDVDEDDGLQSLPRVRGRKPISDVSSPPIQTLLLVKDTSVDFHGEDDVGYLLCWLLRSYGGGW